MACFWRVWYMVCFVGNIIWYKFNWSLQSPYFVVIWFDGILWDRSWYILVASAKCSWRATMSLVGILLVNAIHGHIKLIAAFLQPSLFLVLCSFFYFALECFGANFMVVKLWKPFINADKRDIYCCCTWLSQCNETMEQWLWAFEVTRHAIKLRI